MNLHFQETENTEPTKWFELYVEDMPTDIYYPSQAIVDYARGDLHIYGSYGLDIECEAHSELYNKLVKILECFAETPGLTRLGLVMATSKINKRLREKLHPNSALETICSSHS